MIDTLVGYKKNVYNELLRDFFYPSLLGLCFNNEESLFEDDGYKCDVDTRTYPNAVISINNRNTFCLTLDDKTGTVEFKNIKSFNGDTIRISKWTIYKNGITDTTRGWVEYWKEVNGKMVSDTPYKVEYSHKTKRNKGIKSLDNINVTVNGRKYRIPIKVEPMGNVIMFHGREPRRVYYKYQSKKHPNRIYKYNYFHGDLIERNPTFTGILIF